MNVRIGGRGHYSQRSKLVSNHEIGVLLDEKMTESEAQDLIDAEEIARRFLTWDISESGDGIRSKLGSILGRDDEMQDSFNVD